MGKYLITLLIYTIIGFLCLTVAGLSFEEALGFGMIFGFIEGDLNEIYQDFFNKNNKKGE